MFDLGERNFLQLQTLHFSTAFCTWPTWLENPIKKERAFMISFDSDELFSHFGASDPQTYGRLWAKL